MLAWLHRLLAGASPYALAVNVPYGVAFALVGAEVAWLARRPGPRRRAVLTSAATATGMAVGAFVVGMAYTAVLRGAWDVVATARWETAARLWRAHPVLGAAATFVAWDFSGWVYHLVGHRTRIGWAAHQPHHSGEDFDATLGLRQSWAPFHGLVLQPLLALAGFDLRVAFVCAAVSNCWQVLEHTSVPVRFPAWFSAHVMTPAAHRHHHGREGGMVNLGPLFTWWDRAAGTWVPPDRPAPSAYGPPAPSSSNPVTVELAGWLRLLRRPSAGRPGRPGLDEHGRLHPDRRRGDEQGQAEVPVDGGQHRSHRGQAFDHQGDDPDAQGQPGAAARDRRAQEPCDEDADDDQDDQQPQQQRAGVERDGLGEHVHPPRHREKDDTSVPGLLGAAGRP
jgi:sterol desaturase/sphingolipid hydroxylase (fatty acid hydroxylase superfamily)